MRFGPFTFAPEDGELRRDGQVVPLQRQPAMVLAYLLDHAGCIVTREELIRHVWSGHHVKFDQSLNYCIRQIRRALNESADSPSYLETVPRRGYRWIGPVDRRPPVTRALARRIPAAAIGLSLAVVLAVTLTSPVDRRATSPATPSRQGQLAEATHALHVLSHAVLEPWRQDLDTASAARTLWRIAAGQLGLIFR